MSRQIALDTIWLKPTPRLAHTDYSMNYHTGYLQKKTGLDPTDPECAKRFNDFWVMDFQFGTNDGLHGNWANHGRATDMGHAVYADGGTDQREPHESPFKTTDDVWAFDAVEEYGLPDFDEQVAAYEQSARAARENHPDLL